MVSFPLSLVHGCCVQRQGPGRASWSPVQSVSHSDMQCVVLSQSLLLLWPLVMHLGSILSVMSFQGAQILLGENVRPLLSHPSLPSLPLSKVRSANSDCPPHRPGLVNDSSPFPCGAMGVICPLVFGESRSHAVFLHRLFDWHQQRSALQSEGLGLGFH